MKITIEDDFDLYKITYSGQCFRAQQLSDDTFRFITREHSVEIADETLRSGKKKRDSATELDVSCNAKEWEEIWHPYFDLDTSYAAIRKRIPKDDRYLSKAADAGAGIRILNQDRFEMLISFIISQRKSIPAIKSSVEKLVGLYGKNGFFPKPEDMTKATEEELSSCGIGYRVPYIISAVRTVASGQIDLDALDELSDDELFEKLKTFSGVGDKVANCVALFAYHRTGRAPVDTWIAKVIEEEYGGINPFPAYGNVAGIMQQYIFYYAQNVTRKKSQ
ncbi:MAG: DNA-3-methyladenine glycosylase 2 family protein [Lachnospiraceae bacterium]|nr:DNA-3-methyladenine glycosylase 2 family protein [Lachnospiraceae bacterium]